MSATPIIAIERVTKTYGQGATAFQALKGIDLSIETGDFVAVMGPSGSGKSTMMNILGCLDTPTSGVFKFRGVEVQALSRDERSLLRRKYLGFVFQGFNLLADEPTGNLDTERSVEIMHLLWDLNRTGITILMVTHEAEMASFANTIVNFRDGLLGSIEHGTRSSTQRVTA